MRDMSVNDVLEQFFARMFYLHWAIYLPLCYVAYYALLGSSIRQFILSSVTDEVFFYAEKKGMEMEISTRIAAKQAAFMLSALREIRAGDRALAKRRKESEQQEKGATIGPLLGPAVKADAEPAVKPDGFEVPANLEFVSLELDLPVGFRRLRWALLSNASDFVTEAIYKTESKYEDITMGEWDKHLEHIGSTSLPDDIDPDDFIGATKEGSYLMPRSAFVAANMCFETHYIIAYNDYCFCLKKRCEFVSAGFLLAFCYVCVSSQPTHVYVSILNYQPATLTCHLASLSSLGHSTLLLILVTMLVVWSVALRQSSQMVNQWLRGRFGQVCELELVNCLS